MTRELCIFLMLSSWAGLAAGSADASPSVDLARRIEAQRAIERVYHDHRSGTTQSFDEAVSAEFLERHVRTTLKLSIALDEIWHRPVTTQTLVAELDRIGRNTRLPDRLLELYAALDDDPVLILEAVARPAWVRRTARELFARDTRIHVEGDVTWDAWWNELAPTLDENRVQAVQAFSEQIPIPMSASTASAPCATGEGWDNGLLNKVPAGRKNHVTIWTGSEMLVWGGQDDLGYLADGHRYDPLLEDWTPLAVTGQPSPRSHAAAVWNGTAMIVWGGHDGTYLGDGGRYDPVTDTWTAVASAGAPAGRRGHTAVWTGSEMVVWGGGVADPPAPPVATGGRYDPAADSWTATSMINAPTARSSQTAVWSGSEMIVWGGSDTGGLFDTGGRYDPVTDVWVSTSTFHPPRGRYAHSAVWTGSQMIVFGGIDATGPAASGGRYDPTTDLWVPTAAAPVEGAQGQAAIWTGNAMVVVGTDPDPASYSPATNSWNTVAALPDYAACCGVVWSGTELLTWGAGTVNGVGGRYDPLLDSWAPLTPVPGAPDPRGAHTAVWTGSEMIVWGGLENQVTELDTGGRYDPLLDLWTPTSMVGAPSSRYAHAAVWTGDEMLIWGNENPGGRYDPATDSWQTMSSIGEPFPRTQAVGLWTGSKMVVWGGEGGSGVTATGGVYDPVADSWTPTSSVGAPARRFGHKAIWTGGEMLVWGGVDTEDGEPVTMNDGARYDPASDTWSSITTIGAADSRLDHSAVWTGSELIVWGGNRDYSVDLDDGGRYDPLTDSWSSMTGAGAPTVRFRHSAVWTGERMLVWGGRVTDGTTLDDGAIYDPASDGWTAMSMIDSPLSSNMHSALWTGDSMLVWGGFHVQSYLEHNTGGRYVFNPDDDGDGAGSSCDCAPADGTVFATPREITGLSFTGETTLAWSSDAANSGTGTVYEVARGDLAELPVGSGVQETCLIAALAATSTTDAAEPPSGGGFYYLVRGRNSCGAGSYGAESDGTSRTTSVCP